MKTVIVTASTGSPITLEAIKDHLRIERGETVHDEELKALRSASIEMAQNITGRKLMTEKWRVYFDDWPADEYFELPYSPVQSVVSTGIVYTDSTSGSNVFGSSAWSADTVSEPGRVVLDNDESWPTETLHNNNPIRIEFICGYTTPSNIPNSIIHACKLMVGHWFEQREDTLTGQELKQVPFASRALLAPYRIFHL